MYLCIHMRGTVFIMHTSYKNILQIICNQALNLLPHMKARSVSTQWSKLYWESKYQFFLYLPWSCKITPVQDLKEILVQECFMTNIKPLVQKSVIHQIQRKTLSDSATKVLLFITYLKATDQ